MFRGLGHLRALSAWVEELFVDMPDFADKPAVKILGGPRDLAWYGVKAHVFTSTVGAVLRLGGRNSHEHASIHHQQMIMKPYI